MTDTDNNKTDHCVRTAIAAFSDLLDEIENGDEHGLSRRQLRRLFDLDRAMIGLDRDLCGRTGEDRTLTTDQDP